MDILKASMNVYRLAYQIKFFQDISFYEVENTESD